MRFYVEYYEVFETMVVEPERFIEADDLLVFHTSLTSAGETASTSARSTLVFAVHNGQVTRIVSTKARTKPSKPWGWSSRRCRRSASDTYGGSMRHGIGDNVTRPRGRENS